MIPLYGYAKAKKYADSHEKLTDQEILQLKKKNPGPCLTISRQSGIEVNSICNKLVDIFSTYYSSDWAYFDKDLIRKVISDHNLSPRIQKYLGEERESVIGQMFNEMLGVHPPMLELVHKMSNTILNLAEIGNIILIGRGSNIITSHLSNAYHIRLVAPLDYRIKTLQATKEITKEWAKNILLKEDNNRKEFLSKTFRKDINNTLLYNLTINISLFTFEELIAIIAETVKQKYPIDRSQISTRKTVKNTLKPKNMRRYYE